MSDSRRKRIPALIMPRGIGDRHYCMFNLCRAYSFSSVELYIPDQMWDSDMHYCLWYGAYLNSSLVWLFREITGRKNLGGGMLKAEATDMKKLPIAFEFDFGGDARRIFDRMKKRAPLPVTEEIETREHILIDEVIADFFGLSGFQVDITDALIEKVTSRGNRARSP